MIKERWRKERLKEEGRGQGMKLEERRKSDRKRKENRLRGKKKGHRE
jgi:hypothetical protein